MELRFSVSVDPIVFAEKVAMDHCPRRQKNRAYARPPLPAAMVRRRLDVCLVVKDRDQFDYEAH